MSSNSFLLHNLVLPLSTQSFRNPSGTIHQCCHARCLAALVSIYTWQWQWTVTRATTFPQFMQEFLSPRPKHGWWRDLDGFPVLCVTFKKLLVMKNTSRLLTWIILVFSFLRSLNLYYFFYSCLYFIICFTATILACWSWSASTGQLQQCITAPIWQCSSPSHCSGKCCVNGLSF